ncbi:hypothetical protein RhiirC2_800032 [Rhizophagus irregularis]|uniref:F-box domain-containing protein n=1 Tax=Rhizophagus irregularis TaxID=588596 RepID=A0A2N1M467_9GLOM|nr:hypothetical protein RhiirC2_800032 [Rhizophagus irregularis]
MLDRLPVEIVERIVAKIPDTDLIAATSDCASYIEGVSFSQRKQLSQIIHCKIGGSYNHWNDWYGHVGITG